MQKDTRRCGLVFTAVAIALLAFVFVNAGTAQATTYNVGCLCPLGTYTNSGSLDEGSDPTFSRPYTFAYGGSCSYYSGNYHEYDLYQMEFCDKLEHDLVAQISAGGDSYIAVYYNAGQSNPFDPSQAQSNGCYHAICADDDGNGSLRSKCTIPAAAKLTGFVDVAVSSYSTTAMGSYTVQIDTSECSGPKIESIDFAVANAAAACEGAPLEVTWTLVNTGDLDMEDNPTGIHLGGYEFRGTLIGGWEVVAAFADEGSCSLSGATASCNFSIPAGGQRVVTARLSPVGGLGAAGPVSWVAELEFDTNGDSVNDYVIAYESEEPIEVPCDYIVKPNQQLGMQVHLPILNYLGNDDLCETWIEVQAVGASPMKAVLVTWGEPGFCPPQAAGPLKVECTGLLMPGSTWNLLADQIPSGSKGGMLFKFSTKQLSDVGLDDTFGFDDILADLMCETLFFGVVGDADDFRRFKKAYNEGGNFGGIPQDVAAGWKEGGILAVDVLRDCPSPQAAGVRVTSKYNGIAGSHLGVYDPVYGGYGYYVPLVYADRAEFNSWIYIQNGGLECSSVEIWFKDMEECLRAQICEVSTLAPGETLQVDPNDCVNQFMGSAWIRTSQPMAVAVDITGRDVLMTYVGEPAELNYTFDPNEASFSQGNQVAFGPLMYSEYQGWDTGVQVQNMSPIVAAKVKVYFLDRSGDVITTLVDWVCPRGSQTFFLPVVHDLPGNWVGSVRVESQEWITPGGPLVQPPNIVAVATLIKYSDAQRADTREALAYNLLPEHKIYDWQIGTGKGGLSTGVGLIAIPSLLRDLNGTGVTSELAIANIVPKPGFTDFAIYIYDQNGLMDYVCQKLNEKQVEYIDLQSWGYVNNGFKGSAIISAVFWEHDVFSGDGRFLRNLVGLGAVAVERSKTYLGQDIAGDEAAGARGIPFQQSDVEDEEFKFTFLGPFAPLCPGVPSNLRPKPGEGPTCLGPTGEEVQADWGGSRPVPLTYSQGTCNGTNPGQSHALENPDIAWDGTDGDILEFVNCANSTVEVNFYSGACPGASPYGMIIQFYQIPGGAPEPATPGGCTNLIFCKNPGTGGWCYSSSLNPSGCLYDVEPGIFEVLVQTDLIGGSCAPFSYSYTLTVP